SAGTSQFEPQGLKVNWGDVAKVIVPILLASASSQVSPESKVSSQIEPQGFNLNWGDVLTTVPIILQTFAQSQQPVIH
ncbi:hypothetical protein C162_18884, partial [Paenibacillus sp. FSL R7-269]|uniref:hypothetical protein n=1 Tax=Paenibacillus sp. FSL R7-269 TaxID=1226755 RepID=UPI0003E1D57C